MVLARKSRDWLTSRARALPLARHAWARYRRRRYEQRIERFVREKTGIADRLPMGAVYEATMRCNLHCEFCYVGDLLNIEGEWRAELPLEALRRAFPESPGFQISLTGGEIFMRKDILSVLDLFREK
jgi:MoaA/NifB/PqqE/SkfB family radical SAM enzyme